MATVTQLSFKISSAYDGGAVDRARASIAALNRDLDQLSNKSVKVTVNVDNSALTRVKTQLDEFARMRATATARVDAQTGSLAAARAQVERFGAMRETAHVNVDTDRAHTGLTTLFRDTGSVAGGLGSLAGAAGGAGQALGGAGQAAGGASGAIGSAGGAAQSGGGSMDVLAKGAGFAALAMIAIGPAAALASAAVIGTLGVAFIGIGALVLSKTKEIGLTMKKFKVGLEKDMGDAALAMKAPLLAGMQELMVGLHKLTPAFKQAFAASGQLIKPLVESFLGFTKNVMPGVITALKAAGPVFQGLKTGMEAFGTGLSKMFAGMAAGAKGAGAALSVTLGGIGKILGTVGVAFGQMAAAGARALTGLMSGLNSIVTGAMKGFVAGVRIMDGTLGPFLAALGKVVGLLLQQLLPVFAQVLKALMAGLIPALKAAGPIITVLGQAFLKIAVALTPLIILVGQFAAKLLTALTPAFTALVKVLTDVATKLIAAIMPALVKLLPIVVQLAGQFASLLVPIINQFGKILIALMPSLSAILIDLVKLAAEVLPKILPLLPPFVDAWLKLTNAFLPLLPKLLQLIDLLIRLALVVLPPLIGILSTVIGWLGKLADAFAGVVTHVADFVTKTVPAIAGWVAKTSVAFAGWVSKTAQQFAGWVANTAKSFAGWVSSTAVQFAGWVTRTAEAFAGWVTRTGNAFVKWVADVIRAFAGWISKTASDFAGWITKTGNAFVKWVADVIRAFAGWVAKVVSQFAGWATETIKGFAGWIADTGKKFIKWAVDVGSVFGKWVKDSINHFADFFKWVSTVFWNAMVKLFTKDLPKMFDDAVHLMGKAWDLLKKLIRDPIQAVVTVVYNNGIVKLWDLVAGVFGAPKLNPFTLPAFATGGPVRGTGGPTSDNVLARLSPGEHVLTAAEVNAAGGHSAIMNMRANIMGSGYKPEAHGDKQGGFALGGIIGTIGHALGGALGGAVDFGKAVFDAATGFAGGAIAGLAKLALGSIAGPINGLIQKAADAAKDIVKKIIPGTPGLETLIAGGGGPPKIVTTPGANPANAPGAAQGGLGASSGNGGGIIQMMADAVKNWITSHDVAPTGGGNTADAQKWADAQVGKPYSLGSFGSSFDCSSYMSGIASIILGKKPGPMFTTFAFTGAKAGPATFEKDLKAPFMVGVENRGIGHMAGTLNGKNYEATPPRVRSGPGARGAGDAMFDMHYGMKSSVGGGQGVIPSGQHKAIIDAALAAAHVPPPGTMAQWEAGMNTLITRESAWNSSAVNHTDSNAAAGHPSQGLAQVIPSTFAAFHVAGTSGNILDPVANVAAAIRYIVSRYGNITNVQQANASLPPKGYSMGTNNAISGWHQVGEHGPEWVRFRGGEQVLPHGRRPDSDGGDHIEFHEGAFQFDLRGATKEAIAHAEGPMADKLRMAIMAGVGNRRH